MNEWILFHCWVTCSPLIVEIIRIRSMSARTADGRVAWTVQQGVMGDGLRREVCSFAETAWGRQSFVWRAEVSRGCYDVCRGAEYVRATLPSVSLASHLQLVFLLCLCQSRQGIIYTIKVIFPEINKSFLCSHQPLESRTTSFSFYDFGIILLGSGHNLLGKPRRFRWCLVLGFSTLHHSSLAHFPECQQPFLETLGTP